MEPQREIAKTIGASQKWSMSLGPPKLCVVTLLLCPHGAQLGVDRFIGKLAIRVSWKCTIRC